MLSKGGLGLDPNFIIIGAQRSGTTSLYDYLCMHPSVLKALRKEAHFFDFNYNYGFDYYRAFFPSKLSFSYLYQQITGGTIVTGEASPYYFFHPDVPRRIAKSLPEVKLIVLLRNPVERAFSHYHHERRMERETVSFEEALELEEERLKGEEKRFLEDEGYISYNHARFAYLRRGIYHDQIRRWLRYFPKEQLFILRSEDLFTQTEDIVLKTLEFINVEAEGWRIAPAYKIDSLGRQERMNPATRSKLIDFYRPHNRELAELVGREFDWDW